MIKRVLLVLALSFISALHLSAVSPEQRATMMVYEMMDQMGDCQRNFNNGGRYDDESINQWAIKIFENGRIKKKLPFIEHDLKQLRVMFNETLGVYESYFEKMKATIEDPSKGMKDLLVACLKKKKDRIIASNQVTFDGALHHKAENEMFIPGTFHYNPISYFNMSYDEQHLADQKMLANWHKNLDIQLHQMIFYAWKCMCDEERLSEEVTGLLRDMPSLWHSLYGENPTYNVVDENEYCKYKIFDIIYRPAKRDFAPYFQSNSFGNLTYFLEEISNLSQKVLEVYRENSENCKTPIRNIPITLPQKLREHSGYREPTRSNINITVRDLVDEFLKVDCLRYLDGGSLFIGKVAQWHEEAWEKTLRNYKERVEKERQRAEQPRQFKKKSKGKKGKGKSKGNKAKGAKKPSEGYIPESERFYANFEVDGAAAAAAGGADEEGVESMDEDALEDFLVETLPPREDDAEDLVVQAGEAAAAGDGRRDEDDEGAEEAVQAAAQQGQTFTYPGMLRERAARIIEFATQEKRDASVVPGLSGFLERLFDSKQVGNISFNDVNKYWTKIGGRIVGFKSGGSHRLLQFKRKMMEISPGGKEKEFQSLWGTFDHESMGSSYGLNSIQPIRAAFVWAGYYPDDVTVE